MSPQTNSANSATLQASLQIVQTQRDLTAKKLAHVRFNIDDHVKPYESWQERVTAKSARIHARIVGSRPALAHLNADGFGLSACERLGR